MVPVTLSLIKKCVCLHLIVQVQRGKGDTYPYPVIVNVKVPRVFPSRYLCNFMTLVVIKWQKALSVSLFRNLP